MSEPIRTHELQVFLCHASVDKQAVMQLYNRLSKLNWIKPWLDKKDLLPGQNWRVEIPKAVRQSDIVLVCLSENSINKAGYVQKEIVYALDVAEEKPEDTIFVIPLRLEECKVPERLDTWHWVDYFEEGGFDQLLRGLLHQAEKLGLKPDMLQAEVPVREPETNKSPQSSSDSSKPPSEARRQQIKKGLQEAYTLKGEVEQALLVTTSPTVRAGLNLELENTDKRIKALEDEYGKYSSPKDSSLSIPPTPPRPPVATPIPKPPETIDTMKVPDLLLNPESSEIQRERLLRELAHSDTTPERRLAIGDRLSEIGDPRPGVGTIKVVIRARKVELPLLEWCEIPAPPHGKFMMGADDQDDNPRREVELDYSFKMSKYPITYRQFQTFVDSGKYNQPTWWQGFPKEYQPQPIGKQYKKVANHSRNTVSWYQAVAFTRWLSAGYLAAGWLGEGWELRLPIEMEWEYAARGRDERQYPYGNKFDATKANTIETGLVTTSAVGCFPEGVSPFGVLDMSGNVWEWCLNKYSNDNERRVLRGGSFFYGASFATCVCRLNFDPDYADYLLGFRVVGASSIAPL